MEGQSEELALNTVEYWQERSRRALEAMGIHVPPPETAAVVKRVIKDVYCDQLPISLICKSCSTRMPQFTELVKCTVHIYDKKATVPYKLFFYCVNMKCTAEMIVKRNRELNDFVVFFGATRYSSPAEEEIGESGQQLPNAGSSSSRNSQVGNTAGYIERALGSDTNYSLDKFAVGLVALNANGLPVLYGDRIYLGGPRAERRLNDELRRAARDRLILRGEQGSARRLLRARHGFSLFPLNS